MTRRERAYGVVLPVDLQQRQVTAVEEHDHASDDLAVAVEHSRLVGKGAWNMRCRRACAPDRELHRGASAVADDLRSFRLREQCVATVVICILEYREKRRTLLCEQGPGQVAAAVENLPDDAGVSPAACATSCSSARRVGNSALGVSRKACAARCSGS